MSGLRLGSVIPSHALILELLKMLVQHIRHLTSMLRPIFTWRYDQKNPVAFHFHKKRDLHVLMVER